ncbi:hypothetical protein RhiJN_24586 [Ceratobasidium sp. AG-Ba]|nr:hypothetical protein RhiJN_24586 [Ceratobasidium sp. AG-Ba]
MWYTVFAGYIASGEDLQQWHTNQSDPLYVTCREASRTGYWGGLTRYIRQRGWSEYIHFEILPLPLAGTGQNHHREICGMFSLVSVEIDITPGRPFNWPLLQEIEEDIQYKDMLRDIGINLRSWSVFCQGELGSFHNFDDAAL